SPAVQDSVAFLVERLPPGLRLVLASRTDPPLPLARLRARGQLAELRADDLRFTLGETAAFLPEAAGLEPPGAAGGALQERRGGRRGCSWPRCRWPGTPTRRGSLPRSQAAIGSCWIIWARRCWPGSTARWWASCWRRRCWTACPARCATRSPAGAAARKCWR